MLELIERLQGVWPKIIPVAMEMPIFYVNFSYPNLKDESVMVDFIKMSNGNFLRTPYVSTKLYKINHKVKDFHLSKD